MTDTNIVSMPRVLIIDDEHRRRAAKIVDHAEQNIYRPGTSDPLTSRDPNSMAQIGDYEVAFFFADHEGKMVRHLAVRRKDHDALPNHLAVMLIADLFGFTGWGIRDGGKVPVDWLMTMLLPLDGSRQILVAQPVASRTVH